MKMVSRDRLYQMLFDLFHVFSPLLLPFSLIFTETPGLLNLLVIKIQENKATNTKKVNEIERQILTIELSFNISQNDFFSYVKIFPKFLPGSSDLIYYKS